MAGARPRLTTADMRAEARKRGGAFLSPHYRYRPAKLWWRCARGHSFRLEGSRVREGTWCAICPKLDWLEEQLAEMRRIAAERGGRLLSDEYVPEARGAMEWECARGHRGGRCLARRYTGSNEKVQWQCRKGHRWWSTPANVRAAARWCPECGGTSRRSLEEMQAIARSRGGECLSRSYVNLRTKLRWRCAKGHEWEATGGNVKAQESWCPRCAGRRA